MKKIKLLLSISLVIIIWIVAGFIVYDKYQACRLNKITSDAITEFEKDPYNAMLYNELVLGIIYIPKLDLKYPIIKYKDDATLNLAVNHYTGPNLNTKGNVVLIAHNNRNGTLFNKLNDFKMDYQVLIKDRYTIKTYYPKAIYITSPYNQSMLKEVDDYHLTLITCTNNGKKRRIIELSSDSS